MRSVKMALVVGFAVVLGAPVAHADKLSDFQEAVGKTGCESIPYDDLQGNCEDQQKYVHPYCDGEKGPVTCGSESITRDLKDKLEKAKQKVQELKDKKSELQDKKSSATDQSEKARLEQEIDQTEKDIYEADYRTAVMNVFGYALDKVRGETDEKIKPLARQLRDKYEESKRGHQIAIDNKKNALETCKSSRP
jgi:hypothetical protein